jgi:hypothetical protein
VSSGLVSGFSGAGSEGDLQKKEEVEMMIPVIEKINKVVP